MLYNSNICVPGFYAEGKSIANSPFAYDVVYISGKLCRGLNLLKGKKEKGIVGRKFTHKLLISIDEFTNFYKLEDNILNNILKEQRLPDGFEEWLQEKQRYLNH